MMKSKIKLSLLTAYLLPLSYAGVSIASPDEHEHSPGLNSHLIYEVKASQPRLNRRVTGDIVATLDGVPAEPVDSFVWNGNGSVPVKGWARLKIDPVANSGEIWAEWEDRNGYWTYHQQRFASPSHPTGLRLGASASTTELEPSDPVTTNVYLHGDTTAAAPVLPTVFNLITTWGPAQITHNGIPFDNPYDGPVPDWAGHSMTTVGVRNEDGSVRTISGGIYNFSEASNGAVDLNDLEFHLVFHDAPGPNMTGNLPPPLSFFYHLTFEKVKLEIKQQ